MWRFTAGALLVLLPWFGGLASGEISVKFKGCLNFFYNQTPPVGFTGIPICQRYKGNYHFATMYDGPNHIARYSAYLLTPADGNRPGDPWMYEPQLASKGADPEMEEFPNPVGQNVKNSQAVLADYTNSGYTKGHLAPSQHMGTNDDRAATFTLTNIVPQSEGSNNGPWSDLEKRVLQRFTQYCTGQMYVITGTKPYKPVRLLNKRVSIPEYIWSAYCCPSFKSKLPESVKAFFPTYAALGRNDPNSGEKIVKKDPSPYAVKEMPLANLENILWYNFKKVKKLNLFKGQCK